MFAIVARSLDCRVSEAEARRLLVADGHSDAEIDKALASLESPRVPAAEARLLPWVRDTVHFQTAQIQGRTRELAALIGDAAALQAIGVASLANATVRLALLAE
jgi:hypothetical protein